MRQKSITFRLPEDEYKAFTTVCSERGYSKTGKIREFIRNMVATEMAEAEASAGEWARAREEMRPGRPRPVLERVRVRQPAERRPPEAGRESPRRREEPPDEIWKL